MLLPQHNRLIRASAISDEVRDARGYWSATSESELVPLGFSKYQRHVPSLVVPVRTTDGRVAFNQIRPDEPRKDYRSGKIIKYDTPPGSRMVLDVPPTIRHLLTDPLVPLVITEGARKADAAASVGLCGVALLGVNSWRGTNAKNGKAALPDWNDVALNGREVYIAFDSDVTTKSEVQRALDELKSYLTLKQSKVSVIQLPAGPNGGKVGLDDYLAAGHTAEELLALTVSRDPMPGRRSRTQSWELVRLATHAFRLGQSDRGEPFAVLKAGPNVALTLRGKGGSLRADLARRYAREFDQVPSQQAMADALAVLEGMAIQQPRESLYLRIARHGQAIVLDMGDETGRSIEITPGGWRIVDRSPVIFRRSSLTSAMPEPARPGSGDVMRLRRLLNVSDRSWPLVVGYLVAAFFPDMPHPILFFRGEQGSGKTIAARVISRLVDPSPVPVRAVPKSPDDWAVAAAGSWLIALDNLSSIPEWLSDALCRAATGDGWTKRTLYTDDGVIALDIQNTIVLTAIEVGALRGDLGERVLPIELEPIADADRQLDKELTAFENDERPVILGGLLDLVGKVLLATAPRPERLPRMADFALLLHQMDEVLGTDAFYRYVGLTDAMAAEVVAGDEVAQALIEFVSQIPLQSWAGTASQLLQAITPLRPSKFWPVLPHQLTGRLRRLGPSLLKLGVAVKFDRSRDRRTIHIEYVGPHDAPRDARDREDGHRERHEYGFATPGRDAPGAGDAVQTDSSVEEQEITLVQTAIVPLRSTGDERTANAASRSSLVSEAAPTAAVPYRLGAPRGTQIRISRLSEARAWKLTLLNGAPLNVGLFADRDSAQKYAEARSWRVVDGLLEGGSEDNGRG